MVMVVTDTLNQRENGISLYAVVSG